eukprot:m.44277 g.44277  ORF g.44277 m.44277 type:complete len:831 (+) comp19640_c0_seq1:54-2546(+)
MEEIKDLVGEVSLGQKTNERVDDNPAEEVEDDIVGDDDEDSEYCETDLELEAYSDDEHHDEAESSFAYKKTCNKLNIVPVSTLLETILDANSTGPVDLNLSHHGLGELGVIALAKGLADYHEVQGTLRSLILPDNWLGGKGCAALAKYLSTNTTVERVDLSRNNLRKIGASAIALMLGENSTIVELKLASNGFMDSDAVILAEGISKNFSLAKLDLSHNAFESAAGAALGAAFEGKGKLVELNLSWNRFRHEGAKILCESFLQTSSLVTLHLGFNGLGCIGVTALATALAQHPSLEYVDLGNNRIQIAGCKALVGALQQNTSIKTIKLVNNPIGDAGIVAMIECLKENKSLVTVDLRRISHTTETSEMVVAFLKRSPDLKTKVFELDKATLTFNTATAIWEEFSARKVASEAAKQLHDECLVGKDFNELGAAIGRKSWAEKRFADVISPRAIEIWDSLSNADTNAAEVTDQYGSAVTAARNACIRSVVNNPNDLEAPITAAFKAYKTICKTGPSLDGIKYAAGYAALSGVCAKGAAILAYSKVMNQQTNNKPAETEAANAANVVFKKLFGVAYFGARQEYFALRKSHPNPEDEAKALEAAKAVYTNDGGNAAFEPVTEMGELYAIHVASKIYSKKFPDKSRLKEAQFIDAEETCFAEAYTEYKNATGRVKDRGLIKRMLSMFVGSKELGKLMEDIETETETTLKAATKAHQTAVKVEKAARDAERAAGKYPDFDLKLDFSLKTDFSVRPPENVADTFTRGLENRQMSHWDFFSAVDEDCDGLINKEQLIARLQLHGYEEAEEIARISGLEENETTITYEDFMQALFALED